MIIQNGPHNSYFLNDSRQLGMFDIAYSVMLLSENLNREVGGWILLFMCVCLWLRGVRRNLNTKIAHEYYSLWNRYFWGYY